MGSSTTPVEPAVAALASERAAARVHRNKQTSEHPTNRTRLTATQTTWLPTACSIRLIVPPNMRILAKLSSRRLTFAQQQLNDDRQSFGPTRILWVSSLVCGGAGHLSQLCFAVGRS